MNWIWQEIEEGRFNRSLKEKPANIDHSAGTAVFKGEHGTYTCSLTHCDCQDFQVRLKGMQPCKHILALGAAMGAFDPKALARHFNGVRAMELLSRAYGAYYLFHQPIMSDDEYDTLKAEWSDLLPRKS